MPELRKDPITGGWVIIATDRAQRPSDFLRETPAVDTTRICPLCPGNESRTPPEILSYRSSGGRNEAGWHTRVIPNKFPALKVEGELGRKADGLYDRMNGVGAHELIIETPVHGRSMSAMEDKEVENLFWAFRERLLDLKKDTRLRYILLFKNHGEPAGASLTHSHSQLIALPIVPQRMQEEMAGAKRHFEHRERCVYCDILDQELTSRERLVSESAYFAVIQPYAPRFPFETWVVPRAHQSHIEMAEIDAIRDLGGILRRTMHRIDKALEHPPYNLMVHTSPIQDAAYPYYHWHIEIIPRLSRVAGFEWGTGFYINPTPPEESAQFLREV